MDKQQRSKCCGAPVMSAEGKSVYCSKCGYLCEIMSPEYDRIERMLRWLIKFNIANQPKFVANIKKKLPDISDIIEELECKHDWVEIIQKDKWQFHFICMECFEVEAGMKGARGN